jgi:hypothetical protein
MVDSAVVGELGLEAGDLRSVDECPTVDQASDPGEDLFLERSMNRSEVDERNLCPRRLNDVLEHQQKVDGRQHAVYRSFGCPLNHLAWFSNVGDCRDSVLGVLWERG